MKLLMCPDCCDVVKLQMETRSCRCGRAMGRYEEDGAHAIINKTALVIGIANGTVSSAVHALSNVRAGLAQNDAGHRTLAAWVMGDDAPRVRRVDVVD